MSVLQVPLSSITDEGVFINVETPGAVLRPEGAAALPMAPVRVSGALSKDGETYVFSGRIAGAYEGICDRCLTPAEAPFSLDVYWIFIHGPARSPLEELANEEDPEAEEDDVTCTTFEGNVIDLAGRVWEEIVIARPIKLLCAEDCAGLCPQCGSNFNEGRCTCAGGDEAATFTSKGLKGLKDLFPDLKPDRLED